VDEHRRRLAERYRCRRIEPVDLTRRAAPGGQGSTLSARPDHGLEHLPSTEVLDDVRPLAQAKAARV